jgi:Tfp pilus assembly protein PilX
MKTPFHYKLTGTHSWQQRGVVLFFTLVALLAMSLAAVALIRSVDTSTLIAGNLAFRQSSASSANPGIEAARAWLLAINAANSGVSAVNDPGLTHPFNTDNAVNGYYSAVVDPNQSLTDGSVLNWTNADSKLFLPNPDASGNTVRYVIQRMCRTANADIKNAGCLLAPARLGGETQTVRLASQICTGCTPAVADPQFRITVQSISANGTVSYVQAFIN